MDRFTMDSLKTGFSVEVDCIPNRLTMVKAYIPEFGMLANGKGRESKCILRATFITATGMLIEKKGTELSGGQMERFIMVNGTKEGGMATDGSHGRQGPSLLVSLITVFLGKER
mmetsp:Transcript_41361/g.107122  ORF Transcript_41361/g.107122 Transcript_41361/m.107122 type:complete len:114 (+) Transcript_41361:1551-1892(+)